MRIRTLLIISGAAVAVLTAGAFAFVKTGAAAGAAQAAHGLPQAEPSASSEPSASPAPSAPPGEQSPGASPSPSAEPTEPRPDEPKRDDEPDSVAARIAPPKPKKTEKSRPDGSGGSGGSGEKVLDSGSCKASFYSEGQMTASGERFDPSELTAAHKTLPFGSKVRVTNKSNGESVVVRINDRGPYAGGRCLDLSRAAMKKIGGTSAGVVSVRYEVLSRG
ncbi:septal ring lytic transglycosylase RlpA family protein [Actinomadura sediminis]|uniref:Probable endolytic peptidoglycan transglycosylase RlpA n=1 Tax=Actinomadura sediminis TaxID=1038904 RepID=A0ABW3ELA6_9ACTN